ncbi:hypothetical protein AVEN_124953-1 [Araneus ventricosus]|uniref:Uncharacterized protein n=1 Tax=Araneus ventricosus TaxID=182803 RepID=A0A4Y2KBM4_ARAVE|nr:hypothetical protein AVEN_124953-1 [Araneus ventricosus]
MRNSVRTSAAKGHSADGFTILIVKCSKALRHGPNRVQGPNRTERKKTTQHEGGALATQPRERRAQAEPQNQVTWARTPSSHKLTYTAPIHPGDPKPYGWARLWHIISAHGTIKTCVLRQLVLVEVRRGGDGSGILVI